MSRQRRIIKEYPGPAAELLASLRERADLSVTELSHLINLKRSNYHYYERGFKGKYLPLWLVVDVMGALMPRGVPADDILKLLPDLIRAVMRQELSPVRGQLDEVMEILRRMRSQYGEEALGEEKPPRQH